MIATAQLRGLWTVASAEELTTSHALYRRGLAYQLSALDRVWRSLRFGGRAERSLIPETATMSDREYSNLTPDECQRIGRALQGQDPEGLDETMRLLWDVFAKRVRQFARRLISKRSLYRRRFDEDDVVIEVFQELYEGAKAGKWKALEDVKEDKLWGVLGKLTDRCVTHLMRQAMFAHRDVRRELSGDPPPVEFREPPPEDTVALHDEYQQLFNLLDDKQREIADAKMKGQTNEEIAKRLNLDERKVKRQLEAIREIWDQLHSETEVPARQTGAHRQRTSGLDQLPPETETTDVPPEPVSPEVATEVLRQTRARSAATVPDVVDEGVPIDPVDCTVFAPHDVCVGTTFLVQVVLHMPAQTPEAQALAKECDMEAQRRGYTSLEADIRRDSRIAVHLRMPGLKIEERLRWLLWRGRPSGVQFRVVVPARHKTGTVVGTVTVTNEDVPLGHITFTIKVMPRGISLPQRSAPTGQSRLFELFFVSCASEDRTEVAKRLQMLTRLGKRFVQDCLHRRPIGRWRRKHCQQIDESDAVLLFWSSNAKKSKRVMSECRYAIRTKGIDYLLPVVIEGPPPVEPPEELAELQMNDWLMYVIDASSRPSSQSLASGKTRVGQDVTLARLVRLQQVITEMSGELGILMQVLDADVPLALNKIRYITEKVLHGLCVRGSISWGQAEPTLERMVGPLTASGGIPKNIAIHLRTIQANTSPGSHYQEAVLSQSHVSIARQALEELLDWFAALPKGAS